MKHRSLSSKIMLAGGVGIAIGLALWVGCGLWQKLGFGNDESSAIWGAVITFVSLLVVLAGVVRWFLEPGGWNDRHSRTKVFEPARQTRETFGGGKAVGLCIKFVVVSAAVMLLSFGLCGVGSAVGHGQGENIFSKLGFVLFWVAGACLPLAFLGAIVCAILQPILVSIRGVRSRFRKDKDE